nr:MAG TPA: hypothetical protein [Caudoviricetes sp.]
MAEKEEERTAETVACSDEQEILFENILAEVRASNCKDKTRFLIDSVNDEIKDVMQAINKYGKDGQIKITLKFKCVQANEMLVSAEIEGKKPKGQATGTKMFRDLKGRLYLDDPNQMALFDKNNVRSIKR